MNTKIKMCPERPNQWLTLSANTTILSSARSSEESTMQITTKMQRMRRAKKMRHGESQVWSTLSRPEHCQWSLIASSLMKISREWRRWWKRRRKKDHGEIPLTTKFKENKMTINRMKMMRRAVMRKIRRVMRKRWKMRKKTAKKKNCKLKTTYRESRHLMTSREKTAKGNKWMSNRARVWSNGEMRNKSKALNSRMRIARNKSSGRARLRPKRSRKKGRLKSNNNWSQMTMMRNMNLKKLILMDSLKPIKLHTTSIPRPSSKPTRRS